MFIPDPGFELFLFRIPDPNFLHHGSDPGSRICIKEFKYFNLKIWFLSSRKYKPGSTIGSSDFDIFLEIQYASCVFGLALKS
jgi:hypothetical protein